MSDQLILSKPAMDENKNTNAIKEEIVMVSDNTNKRKLSERTANKRRRLNICNLNSKIKDEAFSQTYEDYYENSSIKVSKEIDNSLQEEKLNKNRQMSFEEKSILPVSTILFLSVFKKNNTDFQ